MGGQSLSLTFISGALYLGEKVRDRGGIKYHLWGTGSTPSDIFTSNQLVVGFYNRFNVL